MEDMGVWHGHGYVMPNIIVVSMYARPAHTLCYSPIGRIHEAVVNLNPCTLKLKYSPCVFLENFGSEKLGFVACNKVSDRHRKLREAERKNSSNFGQKRMVWCRVMI